MIEAIQARLDHMPGALWVRRQTVEHVFGSINDEIGRSHFKTRTRKNTANKTRLHILADNIERTMVLVGVCGLIAEMQA